MMLRRTLLLGALIGCAACSPGTSAPDASAPDASPDVADEVVPEASVDASVTVTVMATDGQTRGVALDATNVYWAGNEGIVTCPKTGCNGAPTVVVPADAVGVALVGANIYWTNQQAGADAGDVAVCPKSGCTATSATTGNFAGVGDQIVVDANNVYWSVDQVAGGQTLVGATTIFECPLSGCTTPIVLATNQSPALWGNSGLALDDQTVYWTDDANWTIVSCAIGGCGGAPSVITHAEFAPRSLAVSGGTLYWGTALGGEVSKCSLADCANTTVVVGGGGAPSTSLVVLGSSLYWLVVQNQPTQQQPSALVTCPITGCNGPPTTLTTMVGQPIGLAVDSSGAYVTGGGLLRVTWN